MSNDVDTEGRPPKETIAALRQENRDLLAQLKTRFEEIAELSRLLRDREVKLAAQDETIKELEGRLKALKASLSWRALNAAAWLGVGKPSVGRQVREIRKSGLFDEAWYYESYPDIAAAGVDPIEHYVKHGAAEGRDPSPQFHTRRYAMDHRGELAGGLNPLVHFIRSRR